MSVSKSWVGVQANRETVVAAYRDQACKTMMQIAADLKTTVHNVQHVINADLPLEERRALAYLRYSISKSGDKSPMKGKFGPLHHNWIGDVSDCKGYLTRKVGDQRVFSHRDEMAKALSIATIPSLFEVHHIDGNPLNNELDNLALVTKRGHKTIHALQKQEPQMYLLRKSKWQDAMKYTTSP